MGIHILTGHAGAFSQMSVLYCSTSDWAFGPVFGDSDTHESSERAESFLRWLEPRDARLFTDVQLEAKYHEWLEQEDEQWKREEAEEVNEDSLPDNG